MKTKNSFQKLLIITLALHAAFFTDVSVAQTNPLLAGIYTEEQASSGESAFMASCASCHANDLRGNSNSPGLVGMGFLFLWEDRPLSELFEKMRSEMPTDRPGSLPMNTYLDLLAFILYRNGYPAGGEPLSLEATASSDLVIVAPP